ncbi:MAG: YncE family protein [Gemmatimonadales bacterium]
MTGKHFGITALSLVALLPAALPAQTFKVEKFDIGGEGRFDYVSVDTAGHVYVSRSNHVMVVDGKTGKVLGDIPDTPGVHGAAFATPDGNGFTTNSGDSTLTMFSLNDFKVIKKIHASINGLDGIMYDDGSGRIVTSNHSGARGADGTLTIVDGKTGVIVGAVQLAGVPEGVASDAKGLYYVNLENKSEIEVVDSKALKSITTWSLAPCDGPSGIGIDRETMKLFVGCSDTSVVVDATSGKVVATIPNGSGVDALAFDPQEKLIYIPAGGSGNVTVVKENPADKYDVITTITTMRGARTLGLDPIRHRAYTFTPEYGPPPAGAPPATGRGRGRGPQGPMTGAWLFVISH